MALERLVGNYKQIVQEDFAHVCQGLGTLANDTGKEKEEYCLVPSPVRVVDRDLLLLSVSARFVHCNYATSSYDGFKVKGY